MTTRIHRRKLLKWGTIYCTEALFIYILYIHTCNNCTIFNCRNATWVKGYGLRRHRQLSRNRCEGLSLPGDDDDGICRMLISKNDTPLCTKLCGCVANASAAFSILVLRPGIVTKSPRCLPQSLQETDGLVQWHGPNIFHFNINSFLRIQWFVDEKALLNEYVCKLYTSASKIISRHMSTFICYRTSEGPSIAIILEYRYGYRASPLLWPDRYNRVCECMHKLKMRKQRWTSQ
jgi:hypothetical protein